MATKQNSSLKHLEMVSNNVSNSNTTGFKEDGAVFDKYLVRDVHDKTAYARMRSSLVDLKEGPMKTTLREFDLALRGPGFFMVATPLGSRYTRNGNFHLSTERKLVNSDGYAVLTADGQEIAFEEDDKDVVVGEDGSIFVGDAKRGEVGIIEFDNPKLLRKYGNGLFSSEIEGNPAENTSVLQGVLEDSNVNSVLQLTKLIEINREVALTTNMINDYYSTQRNVFKTISKYGGNS